MVINKHPIKGQSRLLLADSAYSIACQKADVRGQKIVFACNSKRHTKFQFVLKSSEHHRLSRRKYLTVLLSDSLIVRKTVNGGFQDGCWIAAIGQEQALPDGSCLAYRIVILTTNISSG
jgi:hypothetical protein